MHYQQFGAKMQCILPFLGVNMHFLHKILIFTMHLFAFFFKICKMHAFCMKKSPYHAFCIHATMQCIHAMHTMQEPWMNRKKNSASDDEPVKLKLKFSIFLNVKRKDKPYLQHPCQACEWEVVINRFLNALYLKWGEDPNTVQSVNTGAQTFENMVISRVENGALNVSKLIPTR